VNRPKLPCVQLTKLTLNLGQRSWETVTANGHTTSKVFTLPCLRTTQVTKFRSQISSWTLLSAQPAGGWLLLAEGQFPAPSPSFDLGLKGFGHATANQRRATAPVHAGGYFPRRTGGWLLLSIARSRPTRANSIGPRFSAASISIWTASRHSCRSCTDFGSFLMYSAASRNVRASTPPGRRIGSLNGRSQDTTHSAFAA
jgi:hypothetical protein